MAGKHPYISSQGPIVQAVTQFRKAFPNKVDSPTLKKLGIAPNNEAYIINIFKYLGFIEDDGSKTEQATNTFVIHNDEDFQKAFSLNVKQAYSDLFDLQKEDSWTLDDEALITFFRQSDQTSEVVGKRQAGTFKALAGLAGKRELSATRTSSGPKKAKNTSDKNTSGKKPSKQKNSNPPSPEVQTPAINKQSDTGFGLTVRVEINLPTDGSQATYDRIFKSIRENLIDAYKA